MKCSYPLPKPVLHVLDVEDGVPFRIIEWSPIKHSPNDHFGMLEHRDTIYTKKVNIIERISGKGYGWTLSSSPHFDRTARCIVRLV